MKVCVIGGKGNMGKRYAAILRHEGMPHTIIDKGDQFPPAEEGVTHFIIATPTDTHAEILQAVTSKYAAPVHILVEKPFTRLWGNLDGLKPVKEAIDQGYHVYMVNQYAYYSEGIIEGEGPTWYDFYNSGADGILWDCIQLIHLARHIPATLANNAPVWQCGINGRRLNRELIDLCYVKMLKDFVTNGAEYGRLWGWKDIKESHQKVLEYEAKRINRGAGA